MKYFMCASSIGHIVSYIFIYLALMLAYISFINKCVFHFVCSLRSMCKETKTIRTHRSSGKKNLPRKSVWSAWLWHWIPWQPRFCTVDWQCLPPFSAAIKIFLFLVWVPGPQGTSHLDQSLQSLVTQSITVTKEMRFMSTTHLIRFEFKYKIISL